MNTIIAGSRNQVTYQDVANAIQECPWEITSVVCGMAQGADLLGKQWADANSLVVHKFPARWDLYGGLAGIIRNGEMARSAEALLLIWDGKSRGSKNMLNQAENMGLKIHVHYIPKRDEDAARETTRRMWSE